MMEKLLIKNRWYFVIGAVLIQLALGVIYAWSAFTGALGKVNGTYGFSDIETAIIFSVELAIFTIVMIVSGRLLPSVGPRRLTIYSALALGGGYIAAGFFGSGFWEQLFFIGICGGAGIGLGYVVPIAVGIKWFPDKKGLVSGLGVAGFGFGATLWVKLAGSWGGLIENLSIAGLPGVQSTYIVFGVSFIVLVLIGSLFMLNPPKNLSPANQQIGTKKETGPETESLTPFQMARTGQYYGVFIAFLFSALAGLMIIYSIKLFGVHSLTYNGIPELKADTTTGTAMAWFAVFNGLGRIAWGLASDKFGRRQSVVTMMLLQSVSMLSIHHVFVTFGHEEGFIFAAIILGFNFGGNFSLMPAWTTKLFGGKHFSSNYSLVFIAYGIAGITGPLLAGYFSDIAKATGDLTYWMVPYLSASMLCLIGAVVAYLVVQPNVVKRNDLALEAA